MKKSIYTQLQKILFFLVVHVSVFCQTTLNGKVTNGQTGEPILFGTVALYKSDVLIFGTETDLDGNFFFSDLDSGKYDLEASYVGYLSKRIKDIEVKAHKSNKVNIQLSAGTILEEVVVVSYKRPLIEWNNTTSGSTVTAAKIRALPHKNVNAIGATSAGIAQTDDGIAIRGSRSNATLYYIDGIRVAGNENLMTSPIDNVRIEEKPVFDYNNESYGKIIENKPTSPFTEPLSTFSIDVDRASYSNVRRIIEDGDMPDPDAVRVEEMINYFNYDYPSPEGKHPFAVHTELTHCPWDPTKQVLRVGLQGEKIELRDLPASNIVFLIDISGSMSAQNKLPLVKQSFEMLLSQLREQDRVAIVTYAGRAGVALPSTSAIKKEKILDALYTLQSGGSTAGADGINTAYEIAKNHFIEGGNNRVVLATDGDFNVGVSSNESLEDLIVSKRKEGIFLSVLGYGMGNYKDDKLQILADKGNGNHAYIDDINEAKKILVEEFGGTMFTIAKDVKIQIEFNPACVTSYRLIGYENRLLNPEDFKDDKKDAGEIGSGHSVTALYEIVPTNESIFQLDESLLYQNKKPSLKYNNELGQVKLRYKMPNGFKSKLFNKKVRALLIDLDESTKETKHALAVAEYGMILRDSAYKSNASLENIQSRLLSQEIKARPEFLSLVEETIEIKSMMQ